LPTKKINSMVLGSGLVAGGFKEFARDDRYVVFASGVSDSTTQDKAAFEREEQLLEKTIREHADKTVVYFGTCSVYDPSQRELPYVAHKLAMETMLEERHPHYHIFRLSNLAGSTRNPHTVLNFFAQHIRTGEFFFAWKHAYRNIVDIDDAVALCSHIMRSGSFRNQVVNIANSINYAVPEIIGALETILHKKGNYDLIDKGSNPEIDTDPIADLIRILDIRFDKGYLDRSIRKYYSPE